MNTNILSMSSMMARILVLVLVLASGNDMSSQCYVESDEVIVFSSIGGNTSLGYETIYYLVDDNGIVLESSSTTVFANHSPGLYTIYAVNYLASAGNYLPVPGDEISDAMGDCLEISEGFDILICPTEEECIFCEGEALDFMSSGANANPEYETLYVLTGEDLIVLEISNIPDFMSSPTSGSYVVFAINYSIADGISGLDVGNHIGQVSGDCMDISHLVFRICTDPTATVTGILAVCSGSTTTLTVEPSYTSYLWNTGELTQSITVNPVAQTIYSVEVTDDKGCMGSTSVTVSINSISCNVAPGKINLDCNGDSDGSFSVSGMNGVEPYTYSVNGGSFQAGGSFSGLFAGTYNMVVKDANGCEAACSTVQISEPPVLGCSIIPQKVGLDCNGDSDGSFSASGIGGTAPYIYSINGGSFQTSGSFTGLTAGNYNVVVKDNNNCQVACNTVEVNQPSVLSCAVTQIKTNLDCNGDDDGSFSASGIGGTAPYMYSINGGSFLLTGGYSELSAGTYNVTIMDASGCKVQCASVLITQPSEQLSVEIISEHEICSGNYDLTICKGEEIELTALASGPVTYLWDTGEMTQSITASPMMTRTYTVTVMNGNGCQVQSTVTVIVRQDCNPCTVFNCGMIDMSCDFCHGDDIVLSSVGGNDGAEYTTVYLLVSDEGEIIEISSSPEYSSTLPPGQYFVIPVNYKTADGISGLIVGGSIYHVYSCCLDIGTPYAFNVCPGINSCNISVLSEPGCNDSSSGSIQVNVNGGVGPFLYNLNGNVIQPNNIFSGLSSGLYVVLVTDSNGCTTDCAISLQGASSLECTVVPTKTDLNCHGDSDGSFEVNGTGGTSPYTYSVNGGSFQSSGTFAGLSAGVYNVTIMDASGCKVQCASVLITQPSEQLSVEIISEHEICSGNYDLTICKGEEIELTALASGPVTYLWNTGEMTQSITASPMMTRTYTVTVMNGNGCQVQSTVTVIVRQDCNPCTVFNCGMIDMSCDFCYGEDIVLSSVGGNDGAEYTTVYLLVSDEGEIIEISSSPEYSSTLPPGQYFVIPVNYKTADGISGLIVGGSIYHVYSCCLDIGTPYAFNVCPGINSCNISVLSEPGCNDSSSGSIQVNVNGGVGPFLYNLNGNVIQPNNIFSGLSSGLYVVLVTDSNGCTTDCAISLQGASSLECTVVPTKTDLNCHGDSDGSFEVNGTGGTSPYTYSVNGGSFQSSGTFAGLSAGVYNVTIMDASGCKVQCASVLITQPSEQLSVEIISEHEICSGNYDLTICKGEEIELTALASGPVTYLWNTGEMTQSITASPMMTRTYTVTVMNGNGCQVQSTVTVIVRQDCNPCTVFNCGMIDMSCDFCYGEDIVLSSVGGNDGAEYTTVYLLVSDEGEIIEISSSPEYSSTLPPGQYFVIPVNYKTADGISGLIVGGSIYHVYSCCLDIGTPYAFNVCPGINSCNISVLSEPGCNDSSSGSIQVNVNGGVGPFLYNLNGNVIQPNNIFSGLSSGLYVVLVTDSNGCTTDCAISLQGASSLECTVVPTKTDLNCHGDSDGSFVTLGKGGVGPYMYSINGGSFQSSGSFNNLSAGVYNVTVKDAAGCEVACSTVIINAPQTPLTVEIISNYLLCNHDYDFTICPGEWIELAAVTSEAVSYDWSTGETAQGIVVNPLIDTEYMVTVENASGCKETTTVTVSVRSSCDLCELYGCTPDDCDFEVGEDVSFNGVGGNTNPSYTSLYLLTNEMGVILKISATPEFGNNLLPGQYFVLPINYDNTEALYGLQVGGSIYHLYSCCIDLGTPYGFTVCEEAELGSIGDFVWKDLDGDGVQDDNEPGVGGVTVYLTDCNGTILATEVTSNSGYYLFNNLVEGSYQIYFDISGLPLGCDFTLQNVGADDEDSDVNENGIGPCIELADGEHVDDYDAGLIPLSGLGDTVWHDIDGDGVQDPSEPGIPGVRVNLYDDMGNLVGSQVTDTDGEYLFVDLYPGDYYLEFIDPAGYTLTFPNQGFDDDLDSDVDNSNGPGTTPIFNLDAEETDLSWDAGYYICIPIGDLVWYDSTPDDIKNFVENGINGLRVNLWRKVNGVWAILDFQYTSGKPGSPSDDGYYKFCAPPGQYYIEVEAIGPLVPVAPHVGSDEEVDSDIDGSNGPGTTASFIVFSGQEKCDLGAGYVTSGQAGFKVWEDVNENGLRELEEPTVGGVIVEAFNIFGEIVGKSKTDEDGIYVIEGLTSDDYFLKFTNLPEGFRATTPNMGSDEIDSDVTHDNGENTTSLFRVEQESALLNVDAGLVAGKGDQAVEWMSLDGENIGAFNLLVWKAKDEYHSSHFIVEKLVGGSWIELGKVTGAGITYDVNTYEMKDFDVEEGQTYVYRVVQVSRSGDTNTTNEVTISLREVLYSKVSLYPNPAVNDVNVDIELNATAQIGITVLDGQGRTLGTQLYNEALDAGKHTVELDIRDVPAGVYSVRIDIDGEIEHRKLIILNK